MSFADLPNQIRPPTGSMPTAWPTRSETSWRCWYSAQSCRACSTSTVGCLVAMVRLPIPPSQDNETHGTEQGQDGKSERGANGEANGDTLKSGPPSSSGLQNIPGPPENGSTNGGPTNPQKVAGHIMQCGEYGTAPDYS